MNKPKIKFLVPGFSKCGTTTLCHMLDKHPDIHIPPFKEPMFFINDDYESRWGGYQKFFSKSGNATSLGEGSTFYAAHDYEEKSRQRILLHYPDIRLIFIARDPIDRIESLFRECHHNGWRFELDAPYELEAALEEIPHLCADTLYWARLNNYVQHMDEDKIHILFLEDLKSDPESELRKCFEFLKLSDDYEFQDPLAKLNPGDSKLYDTRLLRKLRAYGLIRKPATDNDFLRQNRILKSLKLKNNFPVEIYWSERAKKHVKERLITDIDSFLSYSGKDSEVWQRYKDFKSS
jgi:hypothetical protein